MKHLLSIILFTALFISCNTHSNNWETISKVETFIEEHPDSAFSVLQRINPDELNNKEEKAKYALLMSIALDKNFIDKTDFNVLQPAIDYYESKGSATDKLRMYYYKGRIYQNMKDDESAMESFVDGLTYGKTSDDILTKARILYTQGRLYSSLFQWQDCVNSYSEAAAYFIQLGKISSYINCLSAIINVYTIIDDSEQARYHISLAHNKLDECSINIKSYYYSTYLTYVTKFDKEHIQATINDYLDIIDTQYIDWLSISGAYLELNDLDNAYLALKNCKISNSQQKAKYLALLAEITKQSGEYETALEVYESYVAFTDSLEFIKAQSDIQFIEERHSLELKNIKEEERTRLILLIAAIFAILAFATLIIIRNNLRIKTVESQLNKQEKEKYRLLYIQMEQERDELSELLGHSNELNEDVKKALSDRLSLLNKFFMVQITDNRIEDKKFNQEIERLLADKDVFMTSTRLAFAGSHPKFIKHLESCGLNEWEINYCCLYALGLKGHEIGDYIQLKSHFNNSVNIRKKLGLSELNIHLSTYIRNLLNEE